MLSDVPNIATIAIKRTLATLNSQNETLDEAGWTISRSRGNLPCHLILAVSVERRFSAVWEDHLKQCH